MKNEVTIRLQKVKSIFDNVISFSNIGYLTPRSHFKEKWLMVLKIHFYIVLYCYSVILLYIVNCNTVFSY